ncbi:hypothetical protein R1sor_004842 [Riccia sorocarpa]|uniref:Ndc10 domain-containing protein n=1 Tax=Riccia sorocarpa TaxID=122646 RepID=A0ABD3HK24_9MARC
MQCSYFGYETRETNQFGQLEAAECLKNREFSICSFGILGFYFFWRWYTEHEPFPSFRRSSDWYNIKLLKSGSNLHKEMDYPVHKESVKNAFEAIGLNTKAKTHVGRGFGARMVELGGAKPISVMHQDLSSKVSGIDLRLSQQMEEIKRLRQHLEDIMKGSTEMRLTAKFDMGWSETTQGTRNDIDSVVEVTRVGVVEANMTGIVEELPRKYKLSRWIATVSNLWREGTEGIGGGPAIKDLERIGAAPGVTFVTIDFPSSGETYTA